MSLNLLNLRDELASRVLARTWYQVRNLDVELQPERVVLRGQVMSLPEPNPLRNNVRRECFPNSLSISELLDSESRSVVKKRAEPVTKLTSRS